MKEITTVLPEVEGSIDLIYGKLGGGKTYAATADILEELRKGTVVFATWPIDFRGVDETVSRFSLFLGIFGLKRVYTRIPAENFHYIPIQKLMDDSFFPEIEKLTNVIFYIDEAYAAKFMDSYQKTSLGVRQRMFIYGTRHFNRRIVIVAQRPNAIHVSSRAMVNRFYRCERPYARIQNLLHFTLFVKTEFQDMLEETVDETKATSVRWYFGKARIFKAYNSKYLRGDAQDTSPSGMKKYKLTFGEKFSGAFGRRPRLSGAAALSTLPPFSSLSLYSCNY